MSFSARSASNPTGRGGFAAPKSSASGSNPLGSGASFAWHGTSATTSAFSSNGGSSAFGTRQGGEHSGYGRVGFAGLAPRPSVIGTPGNSSNPFGVQSFGTSRQVPPGQLNEPLNYPGVAPGVFGSGTFTVNTNGDSGQNTGGWFKNPQHGAVNPISNPFQSKPSTGLVSAQNPFAKVAIAAPTTPANPFKPAMINGAESRFHPGVSPFAPGAATVNPFTTAAKVDSQRSPFGRLPSACSSIGSWPSTGSFSNPNPFSGGGVSSNAFAERKSGNAGVSLFQPHHDGKSGEHEAFPTSVTVPGGTWKFHPHSESQVNVCPVTGTTDSAFKIAGGATPFSNNDGASRFKFSAPAATLKFNFAPKVESGFVAPKQLSQIRTPHQSISKVANAGFSFPKTDPVGGAETTSAGIAPPHAGFTFDGCGPRKSLGSRSDADVAAHANFDAGSAPKSTELVPSAQQESLIALPDVNPYGTGSYGAGRVELTVKAALRGEPSVTTDVFSTPKPKCKATPPRANLGLPNHSICTPLKLNRRALDSRNSLRVAAIRSVVHFRGSPYRQTARSSSPSAKKTVKAQVDFSFKSSLFRDSRSKKELVLRSNTAATVANLERPETVESHSLSPISETQEVTAHEFMTRRPLSPLCPTLSNPQFSTIPEYSQLRQMTSEDLAQVHGFAIRSAEYGVIEWPGVTDVRGLNLDEIIHFSEDEVVVYPDNYHAKPVVGMGLNKRAVLQLTHIYPSKQASSEEEIAAFVERLKTRTLHFGGVFLDYAENGGVWKFEVEHF
ncbi:Nuclear pore complex protein, partial [Globisporangium splendens]